MSLDGWYVNPHRSQYDPDSDYRTRTEGCVPTTGANGANASTGGKTKLTGDQVMALVPKAEETDPKTPGWSMADLAHAMADLGVGFSVRSGAGWTGLKAARAARQYIALAGDSDQFGSHTCSGAFTGDHCIGVHPASDGTRWWIDDPICKTGRWEEEATLRAYATKLLPGIYFGVFTLPVTYTPDTGVDMAAGYPCGSGPAIVTLPAGAKLCSDIACTDGAGGVLGAQRTLQYFGSPAAGVWIVEHGGKAWYVKKPAGGTVSPAPKDCSSEIAAATAGLVTKLADEQKLSAGYAERLHKINGLSAID